MADELNFQLPTEGFDSYTVGILPFDQGILAGAFSVAMQQIRNIHAVDIQQFAQVAYSMESMAGLPFTAGTDVPTDLGLATFAKSQTALGSGVYGTFTNSNFFGCMSGLPYPLKAIYDGIKQLETDKLKKIYQQIYLAVTAQQATFTVNITTTQTATPNGVDPISGDPLYDYSYTITSATYTGASGGGYGRAEAPPPTGYIQGGSGATVNTTINTNPDDVPGNYGKVLSATLLSAGSSVTFSTGNLNPTPSGAPTSLTVICQSPPDGTYAYPYTGGANGSGTTAIDWNDINVTLAGPTQPNLVQDANDEILAIKNASATNFRAANILDTNWNITGTALKQEQRARYNFAPPVPIPYDRWLTVAPVALYVFVDSIPDLSKKTLPHMASQTLEHISNLRNTGGQSVVGMMRQERNQERLSRIGIELDNNIPDSIPEQLVKMLITNGTVPGAVDGVPNLTGIDYTIPANPAVEIPVSGTPCNDDVVTEEITPDPVAFFDVNIQVLREIIETTEGNVSAITDNTCLGPFGNGTGPAPQTDILPPGLGAPQAACGPLPDDIAAQIAPTPCVNDNGDVPVVLVNPKVPIGDTPISNDPTSGPPVGVFTIGPDGLPVGTDPTTGLPVFTPTGTVPQINLQPPVSILPPTLNTAYTGTTLIPSTYNVPDAIDKVIECNCDCWIG